MSFRKGVGILYRAFPFFSSFIFHSSGVGLRPSDLKSRHLGKNEPIIIKTKTIWCVVHVLLLASAVKCLCFSAKPNYNYLQESAYAGRLEGNMKKSENSCWSSRT